MLVHKFVLSHWFGQHNILMQILIETKVSSVHNSPLNDCYERVLFQYEGLTVYLFIATLTYICALGFFMFYSGIRKE